jgi:hypothetical protein
VKTCLIVLAIAFGIQTRHKQAHLLPASGVIDALAAAASEGEVIEDADHCSDPGDEVCWWRDRVKHIIKVAV